jgi:heme o synthase
MIKTYYLVTKPGIIMGNLITTTAGFFFASGRDPILFLQMFSGLGLIIASACVFNNYIDLTADGKMERTKNRPLVQGLISGKNALRFASLLAFLGFAILTYYTNFLAVLTASIGFFIYVVLYSFWKYHNSLATLVGSIAGAIPPVVGYVAASNAFDLNAALLFILLVVWQMPHFFSIAIYRLSDYESAGIPILPTEKGMKTTKRHMFYYILAFIPLATFLAPISLPLTLPWLYLSFQGFGRQDHQLWAKSMFRLSLLIITLLSLILSLQGFQ